MARFFSDESLFNTQSKGERFLGGVGKGLDWGLANADRFAGRRQQQELIDLRRKQMEIESAQNQQQMEIDMAKHGIVQVPDYVEYRPPVGGQPGIEASVDSFRQAAGRALSTAGKGPQPGILEQRPDLTGGITHGNLITHRGGYERRPEMSIDPKAMEGRLQSYVVGRILEGADLETIAGELGEGNRGVLSSEDVQRIYRYKHPNDPKAGGSGTPQFEVGPLAAALRENGQEAMAQLVEKSPELANKIAGTFVGMIDNEQSQYSRAFDQAQRDWAWMGFLDPQDRAEMGIPDELGEYARMLGDERARLLEAIRRRRQGQLRGAQVDEVPIMPQGRNPF